MSQPITIALLIVCGAVLGLGLASVLGEGDATLTDAPLHGSSAATEASLLRIEGLLAGLLAEMQASTPQPTTAPTGPTLAPTKRAPTERARTRPALSAPPEPQDPLNEGGPAGGSLPEPRADRLAGIGEWSKNKALRRQWLFTSERQALDWFGTPDQVNAGDAHETWVYEGEEEEDDTYYLQFHRGRLINAY